MEKIVKKFDSFEEAEKADEEYWKKLPGDEKLVVLEALRLRYWAIQNAGIPGFQRVYRIIKRA